MHWRISFEWLLHEVNENEIQHWFRAQSCVVCYLLPRSKSKRNIFNYVWIIVEFKTNFTFNVEQGKIIIWGISCLCMGAWEVCCMNLKPNRKVEWWKIIIYRIGRRFRIIMKWKTNITWNWALTAECRTMFFSYNSCLHCLRAPVISSFLHFQQQELLKDFYRKNKNKIENLWYKCKHT